MLPFRKILFPVDYSEGCRSVIPYIREMTGRFSAELALVHAYALHPAYALSMAGAMPGDPFVYSDVAADPALIDEARKQEAKRLRDFTSANFPKLKIECFAQEGEPGSVIHEVLKHQGADLVMMPTHGLGPMRRFLVGSVTAKVLHDVATPVWTGTGAAVEQHAPAVCYKSLLCALDGNDEAEAVLRAAASLAECYQAKLSLIHVIETPPPAYEIDITPYRYQMMEASNKRMTELKSKVGVDAPHEVLDTMTADGIREEALKRKADLLVIGRGRALGTFSRLFSRVYPIIRESPCPVLSI